MSDDVAGERDVPRQAAAVAIRRTAADVEVCLIRRRDGERWGIPKGFIDPGHTPQLAALTEAYEEAGLCGRIIGQALGSYRYRKYDAPLVVAVFVMEVDVELPVWREWRLRERRWFTLFDARGLLERHPVHPLLDGVAAHLASEGAPQP
jgi:8-oxo-dGTP pyrophosphatase MutT (NUDIX family)